MNCIILAAGYATRLYPLTENFPKPLLEVGGKTILDWLLDDISATAAAARYVVASNHKFAALFEKWAAGRKEDIVVADDGSTDNEHRLGAVRDIEFATKFTGTDDDILVVAGDNLLDFSLSCFVDYAKARKATSLMRYYEADDARLRKCGVISIDGSQRVVRMVEKPSVPESHWCCPPFYYLTAADAARIPEAISDGCGTDAPGSLLAWLASKGVVYAMEMPGHRYDIGNLESYKKVCEDYRGIL